MKNGLKVVSKYSRRISDGKFVFLSLITFGIYELYWCYNVWVLIKEKERIEISPFWRAIFSIFFIYSMFKHIERLARKEGYNSRFYPGWLTAAWILVGRLSVIPAPYSLFSFFSFLPLFPYLDALDYYLEKTEKRLQLKKFSWWQVVLIIILSILLLIYVVVVLLYPNIFNM